MNAAGIARIVIVTSGIALASLAARPCRAQAEINPDHYEDAPATALTINAPAKPERRTVVKATPSALENSPSQNLRGNTPNLTGANKPPAARLQRPKLQDKLVAEKQLICSGCGMLAGAELLAP